MFNVYFMYRLRFDLFVMSMFNVGKDLVRHRLSNDLDVKCK